MRCLIALFFLTSVLRGQVNEEKTQRVLFLGNSVFYFQGGLAPSFEGFCRNANLDFQAVSQWHSPTHAHGIEFLDYGRIPLNLPAVAADPKIHDLIGEGGFDYVVLEGRRSGYLLPESAQLPKSRGRPIPYAKNFAALNKLHRTIVQSGAQTVLYMHPGLLSEADHRPAVSQIYHQFHTDLERQTNHGQKHEVLLVPAMSLWAEALEHFTAEEWYADDGHGTALARYASACLLYTFLTGNDPRANPFSALTQLSNQWEPVPGKIDSKARDQDAAWIKEKAWQYFSTRSR